MTLEPGGIFDLLANGPVVEPLRGIAPILAFRLLPFAGYVALTRAYSWPIRCLTVAAYTSVSALGTRAGAASPAWLILAYVYCAAAGWVAYETMAHVRSRALWFAVVAALFWGLPLAVVHPLPTAFLVLGWDATLSAYSYGIDTRRTGVRSLRSFLFFLLVNPVLVYRDRGRRVSAPTFDARGFLRSAGGVLAVMLAVGVFEPLHARAIRLHGVSAGPLLLWFGATRLAGEYAAQSGVASIQIGFMRQLGYSLPERYEYPLFARSPADFWRRWNTYVGQWARSYVFQPLIRTLVRRGHSKSLGYALSVIVTFAIVGALHDAFIVADKQSFHAPATRWFLAAGVVVVGWEALSGRFRGGNTGQKIGRVLERSLFLTLATCAAAVLWW